MSNRVLVTGGMGFIGRVLVKQLLDRGFLVDIIDDFSNAPKSRAKEVADNGRVRLFRTSVAEFPDLNEDYTHIFHLASPVGPAGVLKFAGRMGPMIVSDALKMAEWALKRDIPLFAVSTSEVYGCDPDERPQTEDISKIVPARITVRLEYGVAKLLSEISLMNMHRDRGLKVAMIRPYNTVGPGQQGDAGFAVPRFVEAAMAGEELTIFGDGSQKRTFTSVHDLVASIFAVVEAEQWGEVFNVGNPANLFTIKQLAEMIIRLSGSQSKIAYVDPKKIYGDTYEEAWNKIPNITKIRSATGWYPKDSLESIIAETIAAYRQMEVAA